MVTHGRVLKGKTDTKKPKLTTPNVSKVLIVTNLNG